MIGKEEEEEEGMKLDEGYFGSRSREQERDRGRGA